MSFITHIYIYFLNNRLVLLKLTSQQQKTLTINIKIIFPVFLINCDVIRLLRLLFHPLVTSGFLVSPHNQFRGRAEV